MTPPTQNKSNESTSISERLDAAVDQPSARKGTGILAVMQSVAAAMIGVQSSKNKERDFTHGKPLHFIIGGIVGTLLLLIFIWLLVKYLIATS